MGEAVLPLAFNEMICTGMCRVDGSSLRLLSTVQPSMSGRKMSSVTAVGRYWRAKDQGRAPAHGDDRLEALVAGQAQQHAGVMRIVFDNQQRTLSPSRMASRSSGMFSSRISGTTGSAGSGTGSDVDGRADGGRGRAGIAQRQVEREGAALAGGAAQAGFRRPAGSPARG